MLLLYCTVVAEVLNNWNHFYDEISGANTKLKMLKIDSKTSMGQHVAGNRKIFCSLKTDATYPSGMKQECHPPFKQG